MIAAALVMTLLLHDVCCREQAPSLRSRKPYKPLRQTFNGKLHNPYPDKCKEGGTVHQFNMCILKERWEREVRISGVYRRQMLNELPTRFRSHRQDVPPSMDQYGDCLYDQRQPRPFPGQCRAKNPTTIDTQKSWGHLWNEIHGDFSYLYDYVLWDESFPERKENQLWYLVQYLKTLAQLIPNPVHLSIAVQEANKQRDRLKWGSGVSKLPLRSGDSPIGIQQTETPQATQTTTGPKNEDHDELRDNPPLIRASAEAPLNHPKEDVYSDYKGADGESPPTEYVDPNILNNWNPRTIDTLDQKSKPEFSKRMKVIRNRPQDSLRNDEKFKVVQNSAKPPTTKNDKVQYAPINGPKNEGNGWGGLLHWLGDAIEFTIGNKMTNT